MHSLHRQILQAMKAMEDAGLRPIEAMTPAEARAQMEATAAARKPATASIARIEERNIPGPAGGIRLRLYWPNESGTVPTIAYYHGGGHVIGSLDTHDNVARNLCAGAGALVASVDYRMGPEHRFPAAVEDAWAAFAWLHANAASVGADPARLGVHGDSAGGNLAAVVALMARDAGAPQLRLQSLVYPIVDYGLVGASYETFATGYGLLTRDAMLWFRNHYFKDASEVADWRASPVRAVSHAGVAPAIIVAAECDVLHEDGVRYAEALPRAGVPVEYHEFAGMIHAFFGMSPGVDDAVKAQELVCAAFRRAFA